MRNCHFTTSLTLTLSKDFFFIFETSTENSYLIDDLFYLITRMPQYFVIEPVCISEM